MTTYLICSYVGCFVLLWVVNLLDGPALSKTVARDRLLVSVFFFVCSPLLVWVVLLVAVCRYGDRLGILFGVRRK